MLSTHGTISNRAPASEGAKSHHRVLLWPPSGATSQGHNMPPGIDCLSGRGGDNMWQGSIKAAVSQLVV